MSRRVKKERKKVPSPFTTEASKPLMKKPIPPMPAPADASGMMGMSSDQVGGVPLGTPVVYGEAKKSAFDVSQMISRMEVAQGPAERADALHIYMGRGSDPADYLGESMAGPTQGERWAPTSQDEAGPQPNTIAWGDAQPAPSAPAAPRRNTDRLRGRPTRDVYVNDNMKTFVPVVLQDEEFIPPSAANDKEDVEDCRESIQVYKIDSKTVVMAVAINLKDDGQNVPTAVKCFGGVAIGGYPYDNGQDAYIVRCCSVIQVGGVGFGLRYTMKGVGEWKQNVPIPPKVIERYLSPAQRSAFKAFQDRHPADTHRIELIQMVNAN